MFIILLDSKNYKYKINNIKITLYAISYTIFDNINILNMLFANNNYKLYIEITFSSFLKLNMIFIILM